MGCSTFSEYTVIAEISAAKINPTADLNKCCMLGCGISTGWGAAMINPVVKPGSTVAVWGLGAVGLAVVQAAKLQGAGKIYGIDVNAKKFEIAKKFGADECMNPMEQDSKDWLLSKEKWGIEYTYDCTGNVGVMRTALESAHRGFGESCVIGVAAAGKEIATRPFQLVTGRQWKGTAFGGWKARQDVPKLVNKVIVGELVIDDFITHQFTGLEEVNKSIDALHSGDCLRAVVKIAPHDQPEAMSIKVVQSVKYFGGSVKTVKHWSKVNNCEMTFNIYLPDETIKEQRCDAYPVLYCLGGLTATYDNFTFKSHFGAYAQ
jgi:Zn-dependent alcohol dehydrogenase